MSARAEKLKRRAAGVGRAALREEREFEALVRLRRLQIEARLDDERPASRATRAKVLAWIALGIVLALTVFAFGGR